MKIPAILLTVFLLLIGAPLTYLTYHGLLAPIKPAEKQTGPYLIVYQKHIGDYRNTGAVMDTIYTDLLHRHKIETTRGIGIYYDNPEEVESNKLRSLAGCIVESLSYEQRQQISKNYSIAEIPASTATQVDFPYSGMPSIMIGVFRVYPALNAYLQQQGHDHSPMMEIYDQPNELIHYLVPHRIDPAFFEQLLNEAK